MLADPIHLLAEAVIVALGTLGTVGVVHASPVWLPNIRPFNCPFCSTVWLIGTYFLASWETSARSCVDTVIAAGAAAFITLYSVSRSPYAFRDFPPLKTRVTTITRLVKIAERMLTGKTSTEGPPPKPTVPPSLRSEGLHQSYAESDEHVRVSERSVPRSASGTTVVIAKPASQRSGVPAKRPDAFPE